MIGTKKLLSFLKKNKNYKEVYEFINPILTDVSLRDGLQGYLPEHFPTTAKIDMYHDICSYKFVNNIEIGSLVSHKHMPIMKDVIPLYNYISQEQEENTAINELQLSAGIRRHKYKPNIFVLVPNYNKLKEAIYNNMTHLAFITSVSNRFQLKNINKTLYKTNQELMKMNQLLYFGNKTKHMVKKKSNHYVKLYISCIDHCPFDGKIENKVIAEHVANHACIGYNEICLSDTCGKLTYKNYKEIVDICINGYGVDPDVLSIHLHTNPNNMLETENIIRYSLNKKIHRFDISIMETGGCSMTLEEDSMSANLSYDIFSSILFKYIDESVQKLKRMK